MSRSTSTGVYTRVDNSFSNPIVGTTISPTDADSFFDDVEASMNSFLGTSTTSLAIGTGSKTFTIASAASTKVFLPDTQIHAFSLASSANYMDCTVVSYNTGTGALVTTCFATGGSGTITDWVIISAGARGATGATGSNGDRAGFKYTFNSATSGDPASGKFLFNNATFASATALNISETDGESINLAAFLATLDDSTSTNKCIVVWMNPDGSKGFIGYLTGTLTDNGTYDTFSFTPVTSWGSPADADVFRMTVSRVGDKGAAGAGSGDMLAANNLSDVVSVTTAATNLGLGTGSSPQFTAVNVGNASDTTLARKSAGILQVEGVEIASVKTAQGFSLLNGTLTAAVAASALTIAVKTLAGADPSATDPVTVIFRNATLTSGDYAPITLTAATSLVISSGSTLGVSNSTAFRVWIVGFNDAGTFRLGAINCRTSAQITPLREYLLKSSTAEGGAGASDTAGTIYTGTAVSSKAFRILGFMTWNSGLATAGTWSAGPDVIQLFDHGVPAPGEKVQSARATTASTSTHTTTSYSDSNLSLAMDVTSAANPVEVTVDGSGAIDDNSTFGFWAITRGGTVLEYSRTGFTTAGGLTILPIAISVSDFPGASGSTTWKIRVKSATNGNEVYFAMTGGGGDAGASMTALEIMG